MAHIVGYQNKSANGRPATHLFLIVIVGAALIGFMLHPADSWKDNVFSMLGTVAVILVIVGFALNRLNPMGWKRLFHRDEYEQLIAADQAIIEVLQSLNNRHYVMYDFNFELLHVDFLVLGPEGLFVIGKTIESEPMRVEDGILMAGQNSLQKQTDNLWRTCHLINILFKKGYNIEMMPKPIMVAANMENPNVQEFDGISIVGPKSLLKEIEDTATGTVPFEQIQGFAAYLEKRYFK